MFDLKQVINFKKTQVILMERNIVNQIESKLKSMSFLKLIMLSVVLGGGLSIIFAITRDIFNMFT